MNKAKRIIIFTATTLLISSGVGIKIKQSNSKDFEQYINEYITSFNWDEIDIAAHRGFSSLEVENSLDSISLAASKDYIDYIEMDARLTKDNHIVLSHNDEIKLENNKTIKISDTNYEDLAQYTLKYETNYTLAFTRNLLNFEDSEIILGRTKNLNNRTFKVSTLKEGLNASLDKKILLDLKFNNDKEIFTEALKKQLEGFDKDRLIIQSLDIESLKYVKDNLPQYNYLALIDENSELKYIDEFENIGVRKDFVTNRKVQKAIRDDDRIVAIWTLNSSDSINTCLNSLDDYYNDVIYITDYPDVTAGVVNKNKPKTKKLVR